MHTGIVTSARANFEKCHGPTQRLKILGMMYEAVNKKCSLPTKEVEKYLTRIHEMLSTNTSSKELERLVGNLVWASYVEPWGRPFLSALSSKIQRRKPYALIPISGYTRTSLVI